MPRGRELVDWSEIANEPWSGLLVGNGASIAVWPRFRYKSLFLEATSSRVEHPLTEDDTALFSALGATSNFEQVLSALATSADVCEALGYDTGFLDSHYVSIQRALFGAVHAVHVPWTSVSDRALSQVRDALCRFDDVFSTNYDLLLYWSITTNIPGSHRVVDLFWGAGHTFDAADVSCGTNDTRILYLHGGLHLYRHSAGGTAKNVAHNGHNLLDLFGQFHDQGHTPLLVSEGSSADKLLTIRRSDYLTYCFEQFSAHDGPLVVFGHSLGDGDRHLADAMRRWRERRIAVSVHNDHAVPLRETTAWYERQLPEADLVFFDAATHPLGDSTLDVSRPQPVESASL